MSSIKEQYQYFIDDNYLNTIYNFGGTYISTFVHKSILKKKKTTCRIQIMYKTITEYQTYRGCYCITSKFLFAKNNEDNFSYYFVKYSNQFIQV